MDWLVKNEKIVVGLIFAWVIFVATWYLKTNPASWFDEGIFHQIVSNLVDYGEMSVQLAPNVWSGPALISVGYPVFYPAAAAFAIFQDSIIVLRAVAVVFLLGAVLAFYSLVKNLYGTRSAILSLLLLAFFSPLYGNGKNFLGEVPGLFYFLSGLVVLLVAEKGRDQRNAWRLFFVAGLLLGLAAASKPNFLVIIPALACAFAWQWRWSVRTGAGRWAVLATAVGLLLPLSFWAYTQFGGATSGQIWAHYSNPYYINDFWPIIWSNVKRFFTETTPAHFFALGIAALYFLTTKVIERRPLTLVEVTVIAFVGAITLFYVRTAGWYRYFFPAHVMLFMFLPTVLEHFFSKYWPRLKDRWLVAMMLALLIAQSVPMVQERFTIGLDAPTALEPVLEALGPTENILFYSVPQLAARYDGVNYSQYIKMSDFLALGKDNLDRLKKGEFSLVFMEANIDVAGLACYNSSEILQGIRIVRRTKTAPCE